MTLRAFNHDARVKTNTDMNRRIVMKTRVLSLILTFLFTSACASMFNDRHHLIGVDSDPKGAMVSSNMLHREATTPTTFSFDKAGSPEVKVRLEKEGFVPQETVVKKNVTPSFLLNVLFWPGFIVDVVSGAMWNYQPEVFMKLEPIPSGESMAAAKGD